MSRWLLVILVVLIGVVASGSAVAKPSRTVAVGKVQGTETYLAVTYDGHHLRAYACEGSARRLPTVSAWFVAPWDGSSPITRRALTMDGPVSGQFRGHRFALERATGPGGVYEQTTGTTTETSIVLNNGEIRSC